MSFEGTSETRLDQLRTIIRELREAQETNKFLQQKPEKTPTKPLEKPPSTYPSRQKYQEIHSKHQPMEEKKGVCKCQREKSMEMQVPEKKYVDLVLRQKREKLNLVRRENEQMKHKLKKLNN